MLLNFLSSVNFTLVLAVVILIEVVKGILGKYAKKQLPGWVWLIACVGLSFLAALLNKWEGVRIFIQNGIVQAAVATLIYDVYAQIKTNLLGHIVGGSGGTSPNP